MSRFNPHHGGERMSKTTLRIIVLTILSGLGCVEEAPYVDPDALAGFRVVIVDDSALSGSTPYEFPTQFTDLHISVEALYADGERKTDYNGTVQISIVPGQIDESTYFVRLANGINSDHTISIRFAFGDVRIWAEEVGLDEVDQCRDGFDNDGNGLLDFPGDPGCFSREDPSEGGASYVTGISDPLEFQPITIHDSQYNPDEPTGESPLIGEEIVVEVGNLFITNVVATGFYLTDLAETEEFASIFTFNFSYPDGIRVGDRMTLVSGGVAEFQGQTQLTFPNWNHDEDYELTEVERLLMAQCRPIHNPDVVEIEPVLLEPADLNDLERLEEVESGIVRVDGVQISNTFMACDLDLSGDIDTYEEEQCRDECQTNNLCTDLSSYEEFDQFTGDVSGAAVQIDSAFRVAGFDVFADCELESDDPPTYGCPEHKLVSVTGSLRHIFLTNAIQLWVLTPRFACDMVFSCEEDFLCPAAQTCVNNTCRLSCDETGCPTGQSCVNDVCYLSCEDEEWLCPTGHTCVENVCQPS